MWPFWALHRRSQALRNWLGLCLALLGWVWGYTKVKPPVLRGTRGKILMSDGGFPFRGGVSLQIAALRQRAFGKFMSAE